MKGQFWGRALVPALVVFAVFGCTRPTVVGKWQGSTTVLQQPTQVTFDLSADNRMTQLWSAPPSSITASGTYTITGGTLTANMTDVKAVPPAMLTVLPKDDLNIAAAYKLDGDTLTLTYKGQTLTFNRVKDDQGK